MSFPAEGIVIYWGDSFESSAFLFGEHSLSDHKNVLQYQENYLFRRKDINEAKARGRSWELYHILSEGLQHEKDVTILPPVEAPLYRLRDHYRWQVALKSRDHKVFRPLLNSEPLQKLLSQRLLGLRIIQNVDPWDML